MRQHAKCDKCGWYGPETELTGFRDELFCPNCGVSEEWIHAEHGPCQNCEVRPCIEGSDFCAVCEPDEASE